MYFVPGAKYTDELHEAFARDWALRALALGFILGGQGGKGSLRKGAKSIAYYDLSAGTVGLQAGYQKADFVFVFFTDKALNDFAKGSEWTFGMDFNAIELARGDTPRALIETVAAFVGANPAPADQANTRHDNSAVHRQVSCISGN